jgi:hypothetical protein
MSIHHSPKYFYILVVLFAQKEQKHGCNQFLVSTKINTI